MQQAISSPTRFSYRSTISAQWIFLLGAVSTAVFYAALALPAFHSSVIDRFFFGHPIKVGTVALFFWGMTILVSKAGRAVWEQRVSSRKLWGDRSTRLGKVAETEQRFASGGALAPEAADSCLGRRIASALAYVQQGGPSDGLEQRLELLAEHDLREVQASYDLVCTVGRIIPVLGFIGTMLGTTVAITKITASPVPYSMSDVLAAVAPAGDATALALILWIPLMLAKVLVARLESVVLARVDLAAREALGDCFVKRSPESQAFLGVVEGVSRIILQSTRDAWREQGQLWSRTVEQIGESQIMAMQTAVQKFVEEVAQVVANQDAQFQKFLGGLDTLRQLSQKSLVDVAAKMTAHQTAAKRQVELLGQLVADEGRITNLQRSLNENLAALANAQALDQAIHSLTAAAHLLTVRSGRPVGEPRPVRGDEPKLGVAA